MNFLLLILIFPVIIFAGNISISLNNHNGESSYIVNSANTQNLKSKLIFPFHFNSIGLEYEHSFKYFKIALNSSYLFNSQQTTGKDYDWQNNNLTVYSTSDNIVNNYYDLGITLSKVIADDFILFTKFNYSILDIQWKNTYQEDYVQNKNKIILGNTLKFKQKFYQYNFGIKYNHHLFDKISLEVSPSLIYAQIKTQDIHELRNFYTIQNIKAFGYEVDMKLNYFITIKSKVIFSFKYTIIKNDDTYMDYYNELNEKYISYPSSYNFKNTIIGINYKYKF